ncbi:MAG: hypothetical protein NDI61_04925 [Bdellovibrionaceae bacterium]|nr:hypothetical protein [Pseudobdellovibrionaceae bacterium]
MMKKLLIPLVAVYVLTHSVGCTSGDVQEESDVAAAEGEEFAEEGEGDFAEGEEAESSEESASTDEETEESADEAAADEGEEVAQEDEAVEEGDEELDEGEEVAEEDAAGEEKAAEGGDELAMDEGDEDSEFPEDVADETNVAENTEPAPSDESLFANNNTEPPLPSDATADTAAPADDLFKESSPVAAAPVSYAPLQKIKDAPFERGGALLNRVYIARPGDTLSGVSQKIYASNRTKDLQNWNPGVRKSPPVGAKIYYSSPRDPQDSSRMLTYYEDMGITPQVHVTRDGENIRELGRSLLGNADGWKEIWSTNLDVASKGALPSGVELKYWPESAAGSVPTPIASNTAMPTDPMGGLPPSDPMSAPPVDPTMAANQPPPGSDPMAIPPGEPMPDPSMGGMPPTDPAATQAANSPADPMAADPAATTPPVAGTTGEPPPPPVDADPVKKKAPAAADLAATDDTTMLLAVVGVALLLLVGVFMIMRKNRARQIDLSQTQV